MNSYHKAGIGESDTFSAHELAAGITQPRESQLDTERLPQPPGALFPALIFVLLATTICATGYATYIFGEQHIEQERFDDLQTIASLKTDHITHWLNERRGDAFLLGQQSVMAELFAHWLANGHHGDADHKTLTSRLAAIRQAYGYQNVALLDTNAEPVLSATSEQAHLSPQLKKLAQSAISQQRTLFSDLYRNESVPAQPVSFDIATPMTIQTSNGKNGLVGAIVFQIDPERDLYPMVKAWPTHELVAETLLVRREGDEVVVLSELRHQPGSALKMRKPLNQPGLKAALVSQAKATSFQGKDYSGTSVLAAFSPVPGTSWHLVAKINREAIYTPLRQIAFVSVALSLLLLTIAGIAVTAWWQRQRIRYEQNQTALAQEQNLLSMHIDFLSKNTNDIILLTDAEKRIIMANDTALKAYDYSEQELIGMDLHALRTVESRKNLDKDYELTLLHGQYNFEANHQRKDGTSFPVEVSARQIEAEGKTIVQSIIRDITERKSSEKLLQEQMAEISKAQQEWESVFDGVAEPIFLHDNELRVVRANRAYAEHANMEFKDIIGKPYWQVFPKLDAPLPGCPDRQKSENEIRLDNGTILISRNYPVTDKDGEPYIAVHVMEDITERERAIEEIRLKSHFLDASTDSIFVANLEGKLVYINETAWKTRGYSREELLSMKIQSLDTPEYVKLLNERIQLLLEHGEAIFESVHVCKDGSVMPVEVNAKIIITTGKQKLILGSARDITPRKQAEHDLEQLNRTLKTLSAGNMALMHAGNETEVLEQMCRTIVETGGYRLAWVGFAENDPEKSIHPVAYHGVEEGFLDTLPLTWDGTGSGLGPTCTAIRTGNTVIFQDLLNEPDFAPWRAAAQQRGFAASISLPLENSEGVFGALNIYAGEVNAFTTGEIELLEEMSGNLAFGITGLRTRSERDHIAVENQQHLIRLRTSLEDAIQAIAATVEMRDPYTAGHQRRVADLAVEIAREMGLVEEKILGLHLAGIVHDLGKIHVPAEILSKPGKLTEIEFMLIQTHSQTGYDIIKGISFPWPIADIVLQHHERLDGSGYPNKLRNEQILIEAKILAIADVFEAMASHRPYRPGLGIDVAMNEIEKHRGIFYDPEAADACLRLIREKGFTFRQV